MKTTLIFDMDGVLIDTRNSYTQVLKDTFNHFTNKEISLEEIKSIKMLGGYNNDWDLLKFVLKNEGINIEYEDIMKFHKKLYIGNDFNGYINNEKLILPKTTLVELSEKYNLTIFTGRMGYEAKYTLELFGIKDLFTQIITFDEVGEDCQKPNPKGALIIKSNVDSERIYYMGDTVDDARAAKEAGVIGIGILPPQDKSEKLKNKLFEFGAYAVLNDTNDLTEFLEKELILA